MNTIRYRLTVKLLVGAILLLGLGGLGIYLSVKEALEGEFDRVLSAKAMTIVELARQADAKEGGDFSVRFSRDSKDDDDDDFFEIWDAQGQPLQRSKSLHKRDLPARFGKKGKPVFWNLNIKSEGRCRAVGLKFKANGRPDGESGSPVFSLVVASSRDDLDETTNILALMLAIFIATLILVAGVTVPWLLRRELEPLDRLAARAASITADSLDARFPTENMPGELGPIVGRLNDLLGRLQKSFERERQFSADLAHELRTPIAELRSLAEFAVAWPEAREVQVGQQALTIALQMEGIVTRLLELLRNERGMLQAEKELVAVEPLVEDVWRPFAERASAKDLKLARTLPPGLAVSADPVLLRAILVNLFDNAVEYTPADGAIAIDGSIANGAFALRVVNSVERLDRDDVGRFFDRLWRKDSARTGAKHVGLGLGLARAFAEAQGFKLEAAWEGISSVAFTLSGPIA
ncbi:MAG: HAMP domain-containing protein [Opitutaceae bacterium]|nr:HAMP domain-containing protein [Opitutaceae bacterium]